MAVLSSAVSALSTFYQGFLDPFDEDDVELSTYRLLAKLPTIAAYAYKKSVGQPFLYPDNSLGLVENFLRMTFGFPAEPYEVDDRRRARALDRLFILHADHEQNCSTSTVRLVGSSQANLFASVSAGINALFGPLHGGANQSVLEMLEQIRDHGGDVPAFVTEGQEQGGRRQADGLRAPRLQELRPARGDRQGVRGRGARPAWASATTCSTSRIELEQAALADDYFVERKLYPNVDFYTGLIYRAMGFPTRMFTVLFAIGRLPGWIAQWHEMINDPQTKIGRPRQLYTGARPSVPAHRAALIGQTARAGGGARSVCDPPVTHRDPPRPRGLEKAGVRGRARVERMAYYQQRGAVPPKRHTQHRDLTAACTTRS